MKTLPGSPFEVIEAEFLFHLLMRLLANPSCLDGSSQSAQIGRSRQIGEVVLPLVAIRYRTECPDCVRVLAERSPNPQPRTAKRAITYRRARLGRSGYSSHTSASFNGRKIRNVLEDLRGEVSIPAFGARKESTPTSITDGRRSFWRPAISASLSKRRARRSERSRNAG